MTEPCARLQSPVLQCDATMLLLERLDRATRVDYFNHWYNYYQLSDVKLTLNLFVLIHSMVILYLTQLMSEACKY